MVVDSMLGAVLAFAEPSGVELEPVAKLILFVAGVGTSTLLMALNIKKPST